VEKLADVVHANTDMGAACSSGSFPPSRHGDRAVLDQDDVRDRDRRDGET
jgi:hypothetical protein